MCFIVEFFDKEDDTKKIPREKSPNFNHKFSLVTSFILPDIFLPIIVSFTSFKITYHVHIYSAVKFIWRNFIQTYRNVTLGLLTNRLTEISAVVLYNLDHQGWLFMNTILDCWWCFAFKQYKGMQNQLHIVHTRIQSPVSEILRLLLSYRTVCVCLKLARTLLFFSLTFATFFFTI